MGSVTNFLRHAWDLFKSGRQNNYSVKSHGNSSYYRQDLHRFTRGNRQSIMSSALNKIAIDCAAIEIKHCRVDVNGRYESTIDSSLNEIFNLEANKDQTGREFLQDIVMSLLDEGKVAIVPTETDDDLFSNGAFGIISMRTGQITEWFPDEVRVKVYNDHTGLREEIILPKSKVGIVENPLYAIMNEQNSTLQRLIRKMNLLDHLDEQVGSDKLNVLIKLPYSLRTEYHKEQAKERQQELESQLYNSKYGVGYIDSTEQVTQLNRPLDNNLLEQIKYLTEMFYNQIGLTKAVFDGTASEAEMLNYYSRTIEPILAAICNEMKRKFLTKTARSQKQSILFFRDPFKLVPVEKVADIADKFTRNAILSSNELRGIVGFKPVDDPRADELRNANLNEQYGAPPPPSTNETAQGMEPTDQEAYPPEEPQAGTIQSSPQPVPNSDITITDLYSLPMSEVRNILFEESS